MKKIVYIPLDERPCNYEFPAALAQGTDIDVVRPEPDLMGKKKTPGDVERLWAWLLEQAKDADGAILSLDTLVYGGILPSRLHTFTVEQCGQRLRNLRKLKEANPALKVFAFNLIMRCPRYSSSDEEPDYYEDWGREIFLKGYIGHRLRLGLATEEEQAELRSIEASLPPEYWQDYTERRAVNREVNKLAVQLVQEGTVDFLVIPQDDSAPYGLTAMDQQLVRDRIAELDAELRVYMYPGADEVGCTLLARMINDMRGRKPLVYVHYAGTRSPFVTPLYEDRDLHESVKYHILAAGGLVASSLADADLVLCVNAPGETMMEAVAQHDANPGYHVGRNIVELVETADYAIRHLRKPCIVADVAFANGADLGLLKLLRARKLLFRLAGYAGWNTSSNSLGTCIAQGMIFAIYGDTAAHRDFLSLRFVEDAGYCAHVRHYVTNEVLPGLGFDYFKVDGQRGQVSGIVKEELYKFVQSRIDDDNYRIVIDDCYMPWGRMFEVGLKTRVVAAD
ncbi:DUF4127 family protein [Paenibacillus cisolokensis]|uniref:DUF4127 family protein n=1 Tax=Paenibacillus cisolokensis TaxID=1658519 RepID=UPI003D2C5763